VSDRLRVHNYRTLVAFSGSVSMSENEKWSQDWGPTRSKDVVHLANKLAQAGIYTEKQVRQVAELWVSRKGNNALSAAISPAQHDFRRRYAAAIEADDKVTLNTLDLFRKDYQRLQHPLKCSHLNTPDMRECPRPGPLLSCALSCGPGCRGSNPLAHPTSDFA
jgi:hypothetical protein